MMKLHVSKGLDFPLLALVVAGRMRTESEDEREEARLLYAGATRATRRLVIGAGGGDRVRHPHIGKRPAKKVFWPDSLAQ